METRTEKIGGSIYIRVPSGIVKKHKVKEKKDYDVSEDTWDIIFG